MRSAFAIFTVCACLTAISTVAWAASPDIVLADFEGKDYGDWKTTGDAFGPGPAQGTLPRQMEVSGYLGHGLVNSFHGGDKSTGTLTSPDFKIERAFISFLIGGGGWEGKTCMNLLIDGKVVRTATGPNTKPGGSEALEPGSWEVGEFAGKTAQIQIVDNATGGWGHINADQIVLTDRKPPAPQTEQKRDVVVAKRYLNLPIKNGAPKRKVEVLIDGRPEAKLDIELASGEPDWWAFIDASEAVQRHYGTGDPNRNLAGFARNCLPARGLLERGVRFVQLFNGTHAMGEGVGNWDGHKQLKVDYDRHGPILDRPLAALLRNLNSRGLLDDRLNNSTPQ